MKVLYENTVIQLFFFAERIDRTTSTWLEHPRCKLIGILCSGGTIL